MTLHNTAPRDEFDRAWDNETLPRPCRNGCGTEGALHLDDCPVDPWSGRWCDFCLGPLRPDEPSEKPCGRCVADKHDERDKDWSA